MFKLLGPILHSLPLFIIACAAPLSVAKAHPHVWVTVQAEVVMQDRSVKEVRYQWTFDEAFSAFASQGLDDSGDGVLSREELQPLAQVNVESLSEYAYFSDLYIKGAPETEASTFGDPKDYWLSVKGETLVLHFTLPVVADVKVEQEVLLDVYDPSFFVDFSFAAKEPAKLTSAHQGCSIRVKQAEALDDETMGLLAQIPADQREIPDDLMQMTSTMANQVILTCE
ncbi:DUF1007 family protein [Cohaesibacter celericrescens]|uniref:DUF1007 family protein n=1 Tax=Cohaesibacter celericrescens TaxID=2067669 RepID=UPI003564DCCA